MAHDLFAGRYRLDTPLGRGGMSEVWCATDLELDRRVALKLLAPNQDNARFEREGRAVAALGHPNVTQLYDYGEEHGRPYMVLEYLPGGSLEDRLRAHRGRLDDADTQRIAAEIIAGLAHAHARGVVHRDLKPANVLFDEDGHAKLADFGIARLGPGDRTLTEAGTVLGTAAYISPEQAAGLPATAASDVYSFGVVLFRMLTGRLPFESDDALTLVLAHRDSPAPAVAAVRPDAPAALAAAADAALAKDPALRPPADAALLAAPGRPDWDTEPTRAMPAPRRPRRGAVFALVALPALALAGGVAAYEVARSDHASPSPPTTAPAALLHAPRRHPRSTPTGTVRPTTAAASTSTAGTTTQRQTTRREATQPASPSITTLGPVAPATTASTAPTTTAPPTTTSTTGGITTATTTTATLPTTSLG